MACRLPGADGLEAFWDLVVHGRTAWGRLPESRLPRGLYFDPEKGKVGKSYSDLGALVSERPADPAVCPITPDMIQRYDVAHHLFLEVASLACSDAGLDPFAMPSGRRTGVYVGHTGGSTRIGDYVYSTGIDGSASLLCDVDVARQLLGAEASVVADEVTAAVRHRHPGRKPGEKLDLGALGAAKIVREALRLNGPYLVVDAACASSLQAMAIAARALQQDGIDQAIVGGASYCKSDSLVLFSAAQSVSNRGSCPFGRGADGLVTAEGYVALVIKTLSRAIADGDRIRAVIRGIGVASDGKGKSLWAPRQEGQTLAVERAYPDKREIARLDYIEAHATSTQVGDATELGALSALMAANLPAGKKIPIGSVKANIGHTLETAGMASLVKVVLAMEHGLIPPGTTATEFNEDFDWERGPFSVPQTALPWPKRADGEARRAAVNAFGIGGLNVHLALSEHLPAAPLAPSVPVAPQAARAVDDADNRAIAIVGIGSVMPGALSTNAFLELLERGESVVAAVPADRWDLSRALDPSGPRTWHTVAGVGGFVRGFAYDWRRHKVPPKQIAAANPLQFMLLEAADAAIAEVGGVAALDRIRTGVVVGTMFGGEFSNDLQMGLRLPETSGHLRTALGRRGVAAGDIERIVEAYGKKLLERMPALVDETGSFTSSTLASRLTKSFDLMGGALALDAGDCSGLSAISAAADLLRQGDCDTVLCAAGQRYLDLMAFEGFSLEGSIADGTSSPFDRASAGRVPGEGAVVMVLKRLSDARAAGQRIHGVIRGVAVGSGESIATVASRVVHEARLQSGISACAVGAVEVCGCGTLEGNQAELAAIAAEYGGTPVAGAIEGVVGHLGAAAGAAAVVKLTRVLDSGVMPGTVAVRTQQAGVPAAAAAPLAVAAFDENGYRAGSVTSVNDTLVGHLVMDNGRPLPLWQPVGSASATPAALELPAANPFGGASRGLVAALFPGQGSQYTDMFRSLVADASLVGQCAQGLDAAARSGGWQTLAEIAWQPGNRLGTAVWDTQWGMYLGDLLAWRVLEGMGFAPDVIASHSFGEFPSLVAAGAWTFEEGALATKARAAAVEQLGPKQGAMLSVIADRQEVEHCIEPFAGQVWLCAENAPEQSVIGGHARVVDAVEVVLEGRRVRSKRLAVPSPFHTPLLAAAADRLAETIRGLPIVAPRKTVYSSSTAAPMLSADDVRESLIRQMTQTVRWVDVVERLWESGVRTFVEVGPSGVLTGLTRRILEGREGATFISFDQRGRNAVGHLEKVREQLQSAGALRSLASAPQAPGIEPKRLLLSSGEGLGGVPSGAMWSFDATARRRARNRAGNAPVHTAAAAPPPRAPLASAQPVVTHGARPHAGAVHRLAAVPAVMRSAQALPPRQLQGYLEDVVAGLLGDYGVTIPLHSSADKGHAFLDAAGQLFECGHADLTALGTAATIDEVCEILAASGGKARWLDRRPAVALPSAQTATNSAVVATDLENCLVEFVVDQTGYPREIVELDADLEGDLGIDSIRKAQLFGEIGQKYGLSADSQLSLDDFRTLRHLRDYMLPRIGGGRQPGLRTPSLVLVSNGHSSNGHSSNGYSSNGHSSNGYSSNGYSSNGHSSNRHSSAVVESLLTDQASAVETLAADVSGELETFLVEFVVDQTGYPREIVELDADLEGDLGIDSIRKAQLFGEIGQKYGLSADSQLSLDDFRTLRHLRDYMLPRIGGGSAAAPNASKSLATQAPVSAASTNGAARFAPAVAAALETVADVSGELETFLVEFVVDQTGYPREIVELDADLEGDLGIDSIRKAQLFGEIGQKYGLSADSQLSLDDFRTLRHLRDYMLPRIGGGSAGVLAPGNGVGRTSVGDLPPSVGSADFERGRADGARHATAIRLWAREMVASAAERHSATPWSGLPDVVEKYLSGVAEGARVDRAVLAAGLADPAAALGGFDSALSMDAGSVLGLALGFGRHADPSCQEIESSGRRMTLVGVKGLPGGLAGWNDAGLVVIAACQSMTSGFPLTSAVEMALNCSSVADAATVLAGVAPLAGRLFIADTRQGNLQEIGGDGRVKSVGLCAHQLAPLTALLRVAGDGAGGVALGRLLDPVAGVGVRDGLSATATWMVCGSTVAGRQAFAGGPRGPWLSAATLDSATCLWADVPRRQTAPAAPQEVNGVTGRYGLGLQSLGSAVLDRDLKGERVLIIAATNTSADLAVDLAAALRARGAQAIVARCGSQAEAVSAVDAAEAQGPVLHVVIATPWHPARTWVESRSRTLVAGYFACQRWLACRTRAGDSQRATLTAVTALGGDFGLGGHIGCVTGGAFSGLFKNLAREYPLVQVRVVDFPPFALGADVARRTLDEIASRGGPVEVGWVNGVRQTVVATLGGPLSQRPLAGLARGSVWLVTGGARGVTAACARELGRRHGLSLVLVGSTRPQSVDATWLTLDEAGLRNLKGKIMLDAKAAGGDPRRAWRDVEKSIEIASGLEKFRAAGVNARYEACDLADGTAVRTLVERLAREIGPIRGIVHGAGYEAACRFEKKTLDGLEATLGPKCIGLEHLLATVDAVALESVVAFGSTSGRLGGMGQADYSLANDMLAKIVGRLRQDRPGVRATVFHWHAWDEVGMASRPESRFVLEQFGMKFMPLSEGVARFLAEIEAGLPDAEVLVTEPVFVLDAVSAPVFSAGSAIPAAGWPQGNRGSLVGTVARAENSTNVTMSLDPLLDVFLREHRQNGHPLLPAVMGAEMLAQAAIASGACDRVEEMREFVVERPVVFPTDQSREMRVEVTGVATDPGAAVSAQGWSAVRSGHRDADGERVHFSGRVSRGPAEPITTPLDDMLFPFNPMIYRDDGPMWHGPAFRTLTGLFLDRRGGWGRLVAPEMAAVAQPRGAAGWTVPAALLDGAIVGCAVYSYILCGKRVEVPLRFERLRFVAQAAAGEKCTVQMVFRSQDDRESVYDFVIYGADGRALVALDGLHLAVMPSERSRPL